MVLIGCDQNPEVPLVEQTEVSGIIDIDTIWTKEHSPYIVTDDITVERNAALTIQPGVEVRFDGFYALIIKGTLLANGGCCKTAENAQQQLNFDNQEGNKIIFTTNYPNLKAWRGIYFDNTNDDASIIRCAKITYAEIAIKSMSSSPQISDNVIESNEKGIVLDSPNIITHNLISSNDYGLVIAFSSPYRVKTFVTNNIIAHNECGVSCDFGYNLSMSLTQNNIFDNFDYSIQMQAYYDVNAQNNWWGTTNVEHIENQIYDVHDDSKFYGEHQLGEILYSPFAKSEITDAGPRC